MHDACIFQIKNTMFFFYLDSNYCTLLLKNCTYNLFCQQLMNKEKMRIYFYSFENGYICVYIYIYMCVCVCVCVCAFTVHVAAVHLMIIFFPLVCTIVIKMYANK